MNLSKNRLLIFGGLGVFILIIVGYFLIQNSTKIDYSSINSNVTNSVESNEEKTVQDIKIHVSR